MPIHGRRGRVGAIILGAAVVIALPSLRPAAQPLDAVQVPLAAIVFESNRSGVYELYSMNRRGGDVTQITDSGESGAEGSGSPDWSPDGGRIAFSSRRGGDWDLFALDSAGDVNLTQIMGEDDKADWSPDGTRIVFTSRRDERRWADVFVMDADGGYIRNMTNDGDDDRDPSWSPSGMEIAFRSFRDGNYDLYALDAEAGASRRLTATDPPTWNAMPTWSPDGARIAFETNRDGDYEIYVMDNNGHQLVNLTRNPADDKEPVWSPDGSQMIFASNRDGNFELYLLDVATSAISRLTYDCGRDHNADWQRGALDAGTAGVITAVAYTTGDANLRATPDANAGTVGTLVANDCVTVVGRLDDSSWLQVRSLEGRIAWIARGLVTIQGDLAVVPVSA